MLYNYQFHFQNPDDDSLFTSKGLQPSIDDLENIFDDSSDETEGVRKNFFATKKV